VTDYLILTWLPELMDNIRLVCTQPHLSLMLYTSTLLLHRCPLLLLLGLSSAYVVVPSGRWLSRREDQLTLSSIFVLLFPISCSPISCSPQVATSFILLPSVSFRRGSVIPFGIGLFVRSARTTQKAKLNHHKIWSHFLRLRNIGARVPC